MEMRLLREYFGEGTPARKEAERRLAAHEPLSYILGETVFFRETYKVTPAVLIPRPDTERLVEAILKKLPKDGILLDLCTGSGCVAISTLCNAPPTVRAVGVDLSEEALAVAGINAKNNHISDRLTLLQGDVLDPATFSLPVSGFSVIASNPPYVQSGIVDTLEAECHYEPRMAFDGGDDGMTFYKAILQHYRALLRPGGCFLFEIGYDQKEAIEALASSYGYRCTVTKDYGGNDRVALIETISEVS